MLFTSNLSTCELSTNGFEFVCNFTNDGVQTFVLEQRCAQIIPNSVEPFPSAGFTLYLCLSITCVLFAGLMSGLTVGLMSFDEKKLSVMMLQSENKALKTQAKKVYELVSNHHLLLATLVFWNTMAAELMPILLDRIVPSWAAVLVSVTLIMIFGEILPQAICIGPRRLAIAANSYWLIRFLLLVSRPVAWPLGKLLDCLVGSREGRSFRFLYMTRAMLGLEENGRLALLEVQGIEHEDVWIDHDQAHKDDVWIDKDKARKEDVWIDHDQVHQDDVWIDEDQARKEPEPMITTTTTTTTATTTTSASSSSPPSAISSISSTITPSTTHPTPILTQTTTHPATTATTKTTATAITKPVTHATFSIFHGRNMHMFGDERESETSELLAQAPDFEGLEVETPDDVHVDLTLPNVSTTRSARTVTGIGRKRGGKGEGESKGRGGDGGCGSRSGFDRQRERYQGRSVYRDRDGTPTPTMMTTLLLALTPEDDDDDDADNDGDGDDDAWVLETHKEQKERKKLQFDVDE